MKNFPEHTRVCVATLTLLLGVAGQAEAGLVAYEQPSNFPTGTIFASQNDPAVFGNFATAYDNFTLGTTTAILDVHWQGGYFNPPVTNPITQFTVTFWSDGGGQPGAALLAQTFPGNAGETFVGFQDGLPIFDYGVTLTEPFTAVGGMTYWLSIQPTLALPPQWGWHTGTGGDGLFVQDFFGVRNFRSGDLAFGLTVVPEPSTLSLAGVGALLGLIRYVWQRRRRVG